MAWSDAARAAAAEARRRRGSGTKLASRMSKNLGGPKQVVVASSKMNTKAKRAVVEHLMRMNLSHGGYSIAMRSKLASLKRLAGMK